MIHPPRMLAAMTCLTLLVAGCLAMGYGDVGDGGSFATPMFLRGQVVWITKVSRRQLQQSHEGYNGKKRPPVQTEVAVVLA